MKVFQFELKSEWMERPYFGGDLHRLLASQTQEAESQQQAKRTSSRQQVSTQPQEPPFKPTDANWTDNGMQCQGIHAFLDNATGGLFLLAGTRGVGKTSLIRYHLAQWSQKKLKRTASEDKEDKKNESYLFQKDKKGDSYLFQIVDAADLGLFEKKDAALERVLVIGLLRVLQEAMIPLEKRATLWSAVTPDENDKFFRDLVTLVQIASSENAQLTASLSKEEQEKAAASAGLNLKGIIPFLSAGVDLDKLRQWSGARSSQLTWSNSTDALRAELRALFRRHTERHWPVLVLDEWDRFEDEYDTQPKKPAATAGDPESKNKPAEQTETSRRPDVEDALRALSRLKSLLADYPAPVIVIGGESIYKRVRRTKYRAEGHCHAESPYATIFSQHCFISSLPGWMREMGDDQRLLNPLEPYLQAIVKSDPHTKLPELADYLLMEIGPNPHALKLFLAHYQRHEEQQPQLTLPRGSDTFMKSLMGQAVLHTLREWEQEYAGVMAAGPYQRLCWFRYLRKRMLTYWKSPASFREGNLFLPAPSEALEQEAPPAIPALLYTLGDDCQVQPELLATESAPINPDSKPEDKEADIFKVVYTQMLLADLWLLFHFHQRFVREFPPEAVTLDNESAGERWEKERIIRVDSKEIIRGGRLYDLGVVREKLSESI